MPTIAPFQTRDTLIAPNGPPPTVRALKQIRRMRGGSQSHLMKCSDGKHYVVKFQNNPQHKRILVNEFLGTRLAEKMGLPTTPCAVVQVSQTLVAKTSAL